jgi:TRAP-type C4-dicarboxylate transport system permease small subunit
MGSRNREPILEKPERNYMLKLVKRIEKTVESLSSLLLFSIAAVVALQVLFRYVLKIIAPWTEELSRYIAIWMVYSGAIVATIRRDHISVTLLTNKLSPSTKRLTEFLGIFLGLLIGVIIFIGSIQLIKNNLRQMAVTIPVSVVALYIPLTIFSVVSIISLCTRLFELTKGGNPWK